MRSQRLELRGENESISRPTVVQRLLAEPIARKGERVRATVPDRQSKHSHGCLDRRARTSRFHQLEQHLRVGRPAKGMALEAPAQLLVVVYLAIEHQDIPP